MNKNSSESSLSFEFLSLYLFGTQTSIMSIIQAIKRFTIQFYWLVQWEFKLLTHRLLTWIKKMCNHIHVVLYLWFQTTSFLCLCVCVCGVCVSGDVRLFALGGTLWLGVSLLKEGGAWSSRKRTCQRTHTQRVPG